MRTKAITKGPNSNADYIQYCQSYSQYMDTTIQLSFLLNPEVLVNRLIAAMFIATVNAIVR